MALTGRGTTRNPSLAGGAGHDHTNVGRPVLDSPSDYLLAAVLTLVAAGTLGTWLVGQTAALVTGGGWPNLALTDGLAVLTRLPHHVSDPAGAWPAGVRGQLPGPVGFTVAAVLDAAATTGLAAAVARRWGRRRRRRGFASAAQVADVFSPATVTATTARVRPTLDQAAAADTAGTSRCRRVKGQWGTGRGGSVAAVSVDAGRTDPLVHGTSAPVRIGIENSVLVLAAARQGKTSQVVIPWVTSWPGPALVTSVRPDVVLDTAALRPGTARVMDLTGTRWPHPLAWSPATGCTSFDTARRRADLLVTVGKSSSPGSSDATNSAFFGTSATNLLAGWLHAAALTGRSMRSVLEWALDDSNHEPIGLLRQSPGATTGTASMLDALYRSPNETRSNLFTTVLTGVAPLLSETAQAAFCPEGAGFDPGEFLETGQTLYLIVPDSHASELAPLVASFVDDIVRAATTRAAANPTGRLDPPLGLFLDEVANVAPLPHLPQLMSYAAGSGIFVTAVLQDLAQARSRWGRDGAEMLWGAATCKLVLCWLTGDEPETISKLAGTYRETLTTTGRTPAGATISSSLTDRQILTPEAVRTLDPALRQGLVLHATTPPVITRMVRHYEGPAAGDHERSAQQTRPRAGAPARRPAPEAGRA
jgi:type IV secretion system protein VirD4